LINCTTKEIGNGLFFAFERIDIIAVRATPGIPIDGHILTGALGQDEQRPTITHNQGWNG
jgi:hypothetical protein